MSLPWNIINTGFGARHQTIDLYDIESVDPTLDIGKVTKTTISATVSATRMDSLFNRPAVYALTASAVADPDTWQRRFVFSGLVSITLKQTPNTSLSVGLLGLLDPMAPLPIIPYIRYYHKFNRGIELFFDPSRTALRKEISAKHIVWLSNDIGGNLAMFRINNDKLPHKSVFTTLEMKSGLTYEYRLTRKTLISIGGGICSTLNSKVMEQNKNRDPFIKNTQNIVPYAQVSVSCLPFWKGFVRR